MLTLSANETSAALPVLAVVDAMESLFLHGRSAPDRHHHTLEMSDEENATLLLMPAWDAEIGCVKMVNVVPGNNARNLPAISGSVLVFDRKTGEHKAILDGGSLTARRTAAASALAARHLVRQDAKTLLIVGAGKVAAELAEAFIAVRPTIEEVLVWSPKLTSAQTLVKSLRSKSIAATASNDLETATRAADVISCATLAQKPLIAGEWLKPGQHLDLIGAFTPDMREADDEALRRGKIFVDTDFALVEAGELCIPIKSGVISRGDIKGDLYDICGGKSGRTSPDEITIFKSVGNAVMDLAAATVALSNFASTEQ